MLGYHDSHSLGMIAYAKVMADGSAPRCNSGVSVTHVGTGVYNVVLPDEFDAERTPIMIQGNITAGLSGRVIPMYTAGIANGAPDAKTIVVQLFQGVVPSDYPFDIFVFRTILPNEPNAPT